MFTRFTMTLSVKQIISMILTAKFCFDHIVQRGYVWEVARQIGLIMSIIENYDIPRIYVRKNREGIHDVMDGKQRMKAIYDFIQNVFALSGVDPVTIEVMVTTEDGKKAMVTRTYDLNGLYFKDLPEELQDKIMTYSLSFVGFEGMTEDEVRKMFLKLNSGKPLSTKARNIANCRDLNTVADIAKHPFFDAVLTEKGKADRKAIPMVVKMHEMLTTPIDEISFMSNDFNDTMATTKISDSDKVTISNILDIGLRVYNLFDPETEKMARRKFASENHFISLVPFINRALEDGISDQMLHDFIRDNFSGRTAVSDEYAAASRSGSATTSRIGIRNRELEAVWDKFFTVDGEEEPVEHVQEAVEVGSEGKANETTNEIEEVVESVLEASGPIEHRYGMRSRGFSIGCQPVDGLLRQEDDADGKYHDILVYSRELTRAELDEYELDQIA